MGIKNFKDFVGEALSEKYDYEDWYSSRGKTKFSRFLRRTKSRIDNAEAFAKPAGGGVGASKPMVDPIALIARTIGSVGEKIAGISDYLFSPSRYDKKDNKYKPVTDYELDEWYEKKASGKELDDKDVEKFYVSGVANGRKMFGKDFDPIKPKDEQQENFMRDLDTATYKLYSRAKSK